MFETLKILLKNNSKNISKNVSEAPILYFFFASMMVFSIAMFAFLTLFIMRTEADLNLIDIFYSLFFLILVKSSADFHRFFIKSPQLSYTLSTQVNQKKTAFEIFLAIFSNQLLIWFSLSGLYLLFCFMLGININYPLEYLIFTGGIIISTLLGCIISIFYFSSIKYRLIPTGILLLFFWFSQNYFFIVFVSPLIILHFYWAMQHTKSCYLYANPKKRTKEKSQSKMRKTLSAIFYKETTILWRDRILPSFVFSAIMSALFTGFFLLYGSDIFIPESFREYAGEFLDEMFLFLGIYVVVIYTSVFPSLNLFLNEEKTMWLVRNLPVERMTNILGKTSSLLLCYLASIPFIAYISIFVGIEKIPFLFWLLTFSFLGGAIVSIPLGVKYAGKKSDILLLYSVSMIMFVLMGVAAAMRNVISRLTDFPIIYYLLAILIEFVLLYSSLNISSEIINIKYD